MNTDPLRRILATALAAAAALIFAAAAGANPDIENAEDESFMRLLDSSGVLFSFNLQKYQGQRYCEDVIGGDSSLEAKERLMEYGGYSWDVANSIGSSAGVAYCLCADSIAMLGKPFPGQCSQWETNYIRSGGF